jgi:DNA-binding response OmpR family regulator
LFGARPEPHQSFMSSPARASSAPTVIVVHDDPEVGAAIVAALQARGFAALTVHAAHQALRLAATRPPDAWIVDQELQGLSGAELVQSLRGSARAELREAGIIGTSADPRDQEIFTAAGADRFVGQPASVDAFGDALDPILHRAASTASPP